MRVEHITDDRIVQDFGDYEAAGLPWKKALVVLGLEYGLTDEAGRPVSAWARRIVRRGRRAHRQARRDHLQYTKRELLFRA